ncbi:AraC family transcriptional regulator [Mesorhizobium microcysteis]|uniref:AraC family transcriptional regulator n=1 Tax=Neoaquamicrobium microcysteis TaxID=2682781 RepID=A0A5D4GQJ5_9HYPH|nr:helix-turn-helix transcriptional regulator [Mesorhizobium microcysteis]TYR30444.1 AraC family transcriptional regulator [Mesorhizobium microcysteis]
MQRRHFGAAPLMPDDLQSRLDWIEAAPGQVVAAASDFPDGHMVEPHRHGRAQLMHALSGVVMVSTAQGRWMVPPDHAMWIPAGVEHWVEMLGLVRMRSAYVAPGAAPGLPEGLRVLAMSELMHSLIVEAVQIRAADGTDARASALMQLILLEIPRLEERPFALPFPADARLARLCRRFLTAPTPHVAIDEWANEAGMSRRSFTRAFLRETGLSLSVWRRQATLFAALPRLAEGAAVTQVALDLGYDSAPAFTTMFRRMLGASPRSYISQTVQD